MGSLLLLAWVLDCSQNYDTKTLPNMQVEIFRATAWSSINLLNTVLLQMFLG